MLPIIAKTLPFFVLIGLGYAAAATRFFGAEAAAVLTKFVFFFALSAMLFNFTATLEISALTDWTFLGCYLLASVLVYALATAVAVVRKQGAAVAAVEAQTAVIGNVGFLAIPMLVALFGERAAAPVLMVLCVDLIVFGSVIVAVIVGSRGRLGLSTFGTIGMGLLKNPMVMSISAGLLWSLAGAPVPGPMADFLDVLGSAATPVALFAIGASLAGKSAERASVALWLSSLKLVVHPLVVAVFALFVFDIEPFAASMMIATAAMPVAGNIYIIAQHYEVAPQRASTAILFSTVLSVVTLTFVLGWIG
ncbi:AEC family transporter [Pontivivens ytuae]|uniref:AEC family transporter n=1 Tax=Pontivivens ytuae TaxID=2789856 RepID=A0A7S9LRZ6_9RHOB|nr:AEC family transporter [Pontivivens ytuae]QPH54004.1 AEC family transporter [Pontivivens ytuae]